ncbi:hypothetical protein TSOC_015276 [Tetrabaena socialis]|uniref:SAP domain-containing protein n=1 Tax=Tetrabaena socialis TaxID=47790 RepID=A0A2J7Z128_9CHLO|nr:hypothetical protein TSOC_015276 [Tetrabaena socialis]|eukprot:PNG93973.1 hypothetical protein TSOC_015276 [Tetrabaena socialis]
MLADLQDLPARPRHSGSELALPSSRPYICTHETAPPAHQVILTDQSTSALLRIVRKPTRVAAAAVGKKGADAKGAGKRTLAETGAAPTSERPAKKANAAAAEAGAAASRPASLAAFTADELKAKTIPLLKELLKARGLPVSGAKEELIRRLIDHQRAAKTTPR